MKPLLQFGIAIVVICVGVHSSRSEESVAGNIKTEIRTTRHPNGRLKEQWAIMIVDNKDVRSGVYQSWYEDGVEQTQGSYANDKENGIWRSWHPNGLPAYQRTYQMGLLQGIEYSWTKTGAQHGVVPYENNEKHGFVIHYGENKRPLASWGEYVHDKLNGPLIDWYPSGQLWVVANYENGLRQGPYTKWFESGVVQVMTFYRNGEFHGRRREWNKNGVCREDQTYEGGKRHGSSTSYFDSGQIHEKGEFVADKKNGLWVTYDENGDLISERTFENGVPK